MPLFRDIPTPARGDSASACIEWAARRDPIGHRVHLALGMIALFMIPLASTPATIASTILFGYTLLRAPTLWRTWRELPRTPVVLSVVLLFVWLACSTAWSPDQAQGGRLLRGSRYLLMIPALLPLLAHRRLLLQALTAGILFQCGAQFVEYLFGSGTVGGGLSEHGGHTALWYSLALGFLVFDRRSGTMNRWIRATLFVIIVLGLLMTNARSALVGALGGLFIALLVDNLVRNRGVSRSLIAVISLSLVGITAAVAVTPIGDRIENAWIALTTPYEGGEFNIDRTRPLWWRIGIDAWREHPIAGTGLGSAAEIINGNEEVEEILAQSPDNHGVARDDFHSTFITVLAESGVVGMILLVGWMVLLAISILRNRELGMILLTGYLAWLGYCLFNTTLFSGRLVAFSSTLIGLSLVRDMTSCIGLREAFRPSNREARDKPGEAGGADE